MDVADPVVARASGAYADRKPVLLQALSGMRLDHL